jgi:hypothetical protein
MLVLLEVLLINMVILFVEDEFLKLLKKTTDNMMMIVNFYGLLELVFLSEVQSIKSCRALTLISLRIKKKLICVGVPLTKDIL